jgi:hypothetical protein
MGDESSKKVDAAFANYRVHSLTLWIMPARHGKENCYNIERGSNSLISLDLQEKRRVGSASSARGVVSGKGQT